MSRRVGSRFRRGGPIDCPCVDCGRSWDVCQVEPCEAQVAKGAKPKPIAKPLEPIVCVVCGRPGCWTDASGCPGTGETSKGVA